MRVTHLTESRTSQRSKISARITWEDCDRPACEIFFETESAFSADLTCNPNSFLLAMTIPAWHYGEKRVFVDGEVCPELNEGLLTAMHWMKHWYEIAAPMPIIETQRQKAIPRSQRPERSAFFYSGGIDSMSTLRANHLNFPVGHPWRIQDGFLVYGLEIYSPEIFDLVRKHLTELARRIQITLIPVFTNHYLSLRNEDGKHHYDFWNYEYMGAALAAVAHSFADRFSVVSIASSDDIPSIVPYGSHPLLDPNYSSCDLRIRHDNIRRSRMEKTGMIAKWPDVLEYLRVCNQIKSYTPDSFNCGKCEKCIRTMLALVAHAALDKTHAFPHKDVTHEMIMKGSPITPARQIYYKEMIAPLKNIGRDDLVEGIKEKISQYEKSLRKHPIRDKLLKVYRRYQTKCVKNAA